MRKRKNRKPFTFAIDKGIEIPDYQRQPTYNLGAMKVGDSFVIPNDRVTSTRVTTSRWRKTHKTQKFLIRPWNSKSHRCWRTS